jgi:hypothetical protein
LLRRLDVLERMLAQLGAVVPAADGASDVIEMKPTAG